MFKNKYKLSPHKFHSEAGTDIVPVFVLNDVGDKVIQCGKRSISEEVNSFADSTDINVIKKQLVCGNETIAEAFRSGMFAAKPEVFGDATIAPQFFTEYQRSMRIAREKYNTLPESIRKEFDSIDDFINASPDRIKTVIDNFNASLEVATDTVVEKGDEVDAE